MGHHVLISTDNTTVVAYTNRQEGLRSLQLHTLAHKLIAGSSRHFLSLRAIHVPVVLNNRAGLPSRGHPLHAEWKLHLEMVVWDQYRQQPVAL